LICRPIIFSLYFKNEPPLRMWRASPERLLTLQIRGSIVPHLAVPVQSLIGAPGATRAGRCRSSPLTKRSRPTCHSKGLRERLWCSDYRLNWRQSERLRAPFRWSGFPGDLVLLPDPGLVREPNLYPRSVSPGRMANLPFTTIDSDSRALGKPSMSQHDRDLVKLQRARSRPVS
jgi:hypothetical protein